MRRLQVLRGAILGILFLVVSEAFSLLLAAQDRLHDESAALFSGREIPRLTVQISKPDLAVLRGAAHRFSRVPRTNVQATVSEGGRLYTNVSLHLKGSGTFQSVDEKPSLTLDFHRVERGQRFHGLQKISLNNAAQDPTFLCEVLGREMFTAAGIPVPRVTHATVELNGRELGVYLLVEGWNKQFLQRHFVDAGGNLYERGTNGPEITRQLDVVSGEDRKDHRALQALAAAAQEPDLRMRWAALRRTLDVDRFITGLAVEVLLNNFDGYGRNVSNYRIFHDRAQARMVFMPHGLDYLFHLEPHRPDLPVVMPMRGLVASAIMDTEEGRARYLERVQALHAQVFNVAAMTNRVREISARLRPLLGRDAAALSNHEERVERLLGKIPHRHEVVRQQLARLRKPFPPRATEEIDPALWEFKADAGLSYAWKTRTNGQTILTIRANHGIKTNDVGSWRMPYLLEPGRYRFEGRGLATNIVAGSAFAPGAIGLRTSESNVLAGVPGTSTWTNLIHEFTVSSTQLVDLICEYRGYEPQPFIACFDANSLSLTRLDYGLRPPADVRRGKR